MAGPTSSACTTSIFLLGGTAKDWYENHQSSLTSCGIFKSELKGTFINHHRREGAEDLLRTRTQGPKESITGFVEDVLHLSARANPRATEQKRLRIIMRGVRDNICGA
uniref:Putative retrotransposon gag protein n=1 Tax=Ixodes ricinus TaxID=34613 RepID=A0A6B0UIP2_IXORI